MKIFERLKNVIGWRDPHTSIPTSRPISGTRIDRLSGLRAGLLAEAGRHGFNSALEPDADLDMLQLLRDSVEPCSFHRHHRPGGIPHLVADLLSEAANPESLERLLLRQIASLPPPAASPSRPLAPTPPDTAPAGKQAAPNPPPTSQLEPAAYATDGSPGAEQVSAFTIMIVPAMPQAVAERAQSPSAVPPPSPADTQDALDGTLKHLDGLRDTPYCEAMREALNEFPKHAERVRLAEHEYIREYVKKMRAKLVNDADRSRSPKSMIRGKGNTQRCRLALEILESLGEYDGFREDKSKRKKRPTVSSPSEPTQPNSGIGESSSG